MDRLLQELFKRSCKAGLDGNNLGDFVTAEERVKLRELYPLSDSPKEVPKDESSPLPS